jgi:hypothetical protein
MLFFKKQQPAPKSRYDFGQALALFVDSYRDSVDALVLASALDAAATELKSIRELGLFGSHDAQGCR